MFSHTTHNSIYPGEMVLYFLFRILIQCIEFCHLLHKPNLIYNQLYNQIVRIQNEMILQRHS